MSTIKFGTNTTAFPLAGTPTFDGTYETIIIQKSSTVTSDAVLAALKGTDSFTIDSGAAQTGFKAPDNVTVGASTITAIMTKQTSDEQTLEEVQTELAYIQSAFASLQASE